uniref:Capsid protein n=1 Tax=Soybean thrips tombus-like virus 5 TaxID=2802947 RepID=A0A7T8G260_9TOMB|nr:hypothetical protein 2 [Soybean thrips tombus-like virus 5]
MLNNYRGRGRGMNAAMNLAAAAGGTAARVAVDRLAGWLATPSQPQPQPTPQPGPSSNPTGRGRRRGKGRGRRGARQAQGPTRSGAQIVMRDTEVIGEVPNKLTTYSFNPAVNETPRLSQHEKMYARYRFKRLTISYKPLVGTATTGSVTIGAMVGTAYDKIKKADDIMKLRPMLVTPGWKAASFTLGSDIDLARYMLCGDNTADGVAVTIYAIGSAEHLGLIQVSYEVEFSHPRPF